MISALDSRTQQFLADLNRIGSRLSGAQEQIASGKRINRVSDSPDQISSLLAARSELAATTQIQSNFNRVKGEVDTAEQTLQQAVSLLDRAATLGAEGATSILNAEQRQIIASELGGLQQQLVGLAATATDGRYLFGGDSDQQAPYTYDATGTPPFGTYQGSPATRQVLHPAGIRIDVAHTAQQIFEDPDPSRNIFAAIESLRQALLTDDTTAIAHSLAQVRTSNVHLNNELAFYGQVQNEVASGLDYAASHKIRLQTQIAATEEADLASAIIELNQAKLHQDATLQAGAKWQSRPSLFDYLK
jgi:flagellar hook-associated protein 3 FlgL